ncbi:prepilin-type N-terminal cleavage/methylation domain-containing protein, partial [Burkholderia gladioli]
CVSRAAGASGWRRTHQLQHVVCLRISVMVIRRFGERDQFGRWCCAVNGL